MRILAIETATSWQSVAILDGPAVLAGLDQEAPGSHAAVLLPTIDRLLKEAGLALKDLDGLAVSIGPGSFTGLRVGLATMLGFRTITGLPLAAVPTLEGMAWNVRGVPEVLCPVLAGRKGEVYWAQFRWVGEQRLERVAEEHVGPPASLGGSLGEPTILYGEGWSRDAEAIRAAAPGGTIIELEVSREAGRPSAVSIGLAGMAQLACGKKAGSGIIPLYVQRSEAELKYEEAGAASPLARRQAKIMRKRAGRMAVAGAKRKSHK